MAVLCSALLASACRPTIHSFRAEPHRTCAGSPVHLFWDASSGGEISAQPAVSGVGEVASSGTTVVKPVQTTKFYFDSWNLWGTTPGQADVEVFAVPTAPTTLEGAVSAPPATQCENGVLSVSFDAPRDSWDERLLIAGVELPPNIHRHYHVEHGQASADLDPGMRSAAFDHLPISGTWVLSTPLDAAEKCGESTPLSLLINVFAGCGAEGTQ